jgi:hypothetical protein
MLLTISVYGAMRLEAASQLTSAVQITANITKKASDVTLSVHVGGAKFRTTGYVGVSVWGLPDTISITDECGSDMQCAAAPCNSKLLSPQCEFIFGAIFPSDASGNINETMSDALVVGIYQHVSVLSMPCESKAKCESDFKTGGSHLDLRLPTT